MNPMAKQSKKPADLNRLAAAIVGDATANNADRPKGEPVLKNRRKMGKVKS